MAPFRQQHYMLAFWEALIEELRGCAMKGYALKRLYVATAGVECRKDADLIDETPMAYKSIDAVMEAQRDLVNVVHTLKQIVCVKG